MIFTHSHIQRGIITALLTLMVMNHGNGDFDSFFRQALKGNSAVMGLIR